MPAPRKPRKIPPWRRNQGPVLSIFREGALLRLDFEYSPERVQAVKAMLGARYDPLDKSWSVPAELLATVRACKAFPAQQVINALAGDNAAIIPHDQAMEQLRANPFAVDEGVIASVRVDLIVRFAVERRRLRILARIGSQAHKILKKTESALYSLQDGAYVLPVEGLTPFLKLLRDAKSSFAIDLVAGAALAGSGPLRRSILATPGSFGGEDLSAALLTPFITELQEEPDTFRPCYFTAEQFKLAFPGVQRRSGQKPFVLDMRGLLALSSRLGSLPFTVWLTKEVTRVLAERRESLLREVSSSQGPLDDVVVDVLDCPLLWKTATSGRGVLVINLEPESELRDLTLTRLSELLDTTYAKGGRVIFAELPDSQLVSVVAEMRHLCEVHGLGEIPRSESFERLERDVARRMTLRERSAFFGSLEDVPAEALVGLERENALRLFPHQRVAIQWLQQTPYAFLGDDMGLGKTLSVLSYYVTLRRTDSFSLLMVACPNSLVRNWLREISMWFPELKATALTGDKGTKAWTLRMLNSGALETDVVIVNYEGVRLPYVMPELQRLASERRTLLALDESQRVKNPTAKTFKALNEIAPSCDRRVLLSGTPAPKDVSDLWAQLRILDGGERFGRSFYKWLDRVAELGTEFSDFAVKKWRDDEVNESILRAQEILLRRRKERVVNLPEKTFSLREVELSGSQLERYEEIREGLILRMRTITGEQFVREITNILEEYLRAVQVSSNPRLIDPGWKGEPAKFLELDEIVNEVVREQGQKIVVWTNYLGNVRELCERYKDLGAAPFSGEVSAAARDLTVKAFQEGDQIRILVAIPAAGGVGITLTAAQTAVYIDKTWNAEHWMQSVDRIHRIGQRGTVNVISLLGCKVDEIIHWNLRRKEQRQAEILGDTRQAEIAIPTDSAGISREELMQALEML